MSDESGTERSETMDVDDAEFIFRTYGPYLRMVVRRRLTPKLRTRFDSQDVVQSVWSETLLRERAGQASRSFADESRLRSFLVRLTMSRFFDHCRKHRASLRAEQRLSARDERELHGRRAEQPGERVEADELWARLLATCPPAHRELLRLKTEGLALDEIAERTGYHASSVRRILYELAGRLDAEDAD